MPLKRLTISPDPVIPLVVLNHINHSVKILRGIIPDEHTDKRVHVNVNRDIHL